MKNTNRRNLKQSAYGVVVQKELDKGQFLFICLGFDFTLFRVAIAKDNLNSSSKFESSLLHR